jgi:ring-1,2-phenylacetyl-CoA epoxidase subunit PaaE
MRALTDDAVEITLRVPPELASGYGFVPGQHITVLHPTDVDVVRRTYSISSAARPDEIDAIRFAVKRIEGGVFSTYATSGGLQCGDKVQVMVPSGRFGRATSSDEAAHYGLIAAGSGITPMMSIMASCLDRNVASRFSLLYCNRTRASTMFRDDLKELERRHNGRLRVTHTLSQEAVGGHLYGRIDGRKLETAFRIGEIGHWLICGPEQMTKTVRGYLQGYGVADELIQTELFHSDDAGEAVVLPDVVSDVLIRSGGAETRFRLPAREDTVLTRALREGASLPYGCVDGVCATCRAKVTEGAVVMDRCSALDNDEIADGYVLACQSHPVTGRLVLDFDV